MAGNIKKGPAHRLPILSSWEKAVKRGPADEDKLDQNAQM